MPSVAPSWNRTPLSRSAALDLVASLDRCDDVKGAFLTFVMIPVEERIGEWRFAGASASLGQALRRIGDFAVEVGDTRKDGETTLREWLEPGALEIWTDMSKAWSYEDLPLAEIGKHRVVLFGEGQAPYDDVGFCVLKIRSLKGSPFETRAPETARPATWPARDE